jgi:hypothetical protein
MNLRSASYRMLLLIATLGPSAIAAACGGAPPAAPTSSPATPAATVQSLSISGLHESVSVGDAVRLQAAASYSDGRREDVTGVARWSSTNLVCIVTSAGVLTAREIGECAVDAAYSGASATATARISPATTFSISGTVTDRWLPREPGIASAKVTLTTGPQAGRTETTDAAGRYLFSRVPVGPVGIRAEARGFDSNSAGATPELATVNFSLVPLVATISWQLDDQFFQAANFPFRVQHPGAVTLTVFSDRGDCDDTFWADVFWAAVPREALWHAFPCYANNPSVVTGSIEPGQYELRIHSGPSSARRWVTFVHPR